MTDMTGKVAVVTGASSGIGEATARELAKLGVKVALAARRKDRLEALSQEITEAGGEALVMETDVTDKAACQQVIKKVQAEWGKIDILVNNAGIMLLGPALDAELKDWEHMVDLNVKGLLYMTHAVLPVMKAQGSGHLVNISSVAGRTNRPGSAVYNLTKWGVGAFTESLRQELSGNKLVIRTTLIEPGAVDTELQDHLNDAAKEQWKKNFSDLTRLQAEDIAAGIVYAVTQPEHVSVNELLIRPTEQVG